MRVRLHIISLVLVLLPAVGHSQVGSGGIDAMRKQMRERFDNAQAQSHKQFDDERERARKEFEEFRRKANEEFAAALEGTWKEVFPNAAMKPPANPKPPTPPVVAQEPALPTPRPKPMPTVKPRPAKETPRQPDGGAPDNSVPAQPIPTVPPIPATPQPKPIAHEKPKPLPPPVVAEEPPMPEVPPAAARTQQFAFDFYGQRCEVERVDKVSVSGLTSRAIASAWKKMSGSRYDALLRDMRQLRHTLKLNDWGYLMLVRKYCRALYGGEGGAAVVVEAWLLSQSGIKVHFAKDGGRLLLMAASSRQLYNHKYITIGGANYYFIGDDPKNQVMLVDHTFPRTHEADLRMTEMPALPERNDGSRQLVADRYPQMKVSVSLNRNLIDFMNDYHHGCQFAEYAIPSISDRLRRQLYPTLRETLKGKDEVTAANMLINFVQTAFDYATDDDQFGYERPLFGDETFHYPYSDCEDRSILFAVLVRELLGLDVVMLSFPGHAATAVRFNGGPKGTYLNIDGEAYTVCDPTYIGADIGMAMPQFENQSVEVIRLN